MRILPSWSTVMKREGRVDARVDHLEVQPVALGDGLPEGDAAPPIGSTPILRPAAADGVHVDDVCQVGDVGRDVVVTRAWSRPRAPLERACACTPVEAVAQDLVGAVLDRLGGAGVGRAAVGRVVLEAAVVGRVVRRGDDHAVGQARRAAAVVGRGWRGRSPASACSRSPPGSSPRTPLAANTSSAVVERRLGEGVGVHAEEERPGDPLLLRGTRRSPGRWPGCGPR